MQTWRQKQQLLATNAAREEERTLSGWWKRAARNLWRLQSDRRKDHEGLATRHVAELAALENQRVEVRRGSTSDLIVATCTKRVVFYVPTAFKAPRLIDLSAGRAVIGASKWWHQVFSAACSNSVCGVLLVPAVERVFVRRMVSFPKLQGGSLARALALFRQEQRGRQLLWV